MTAEEWRQKEEAILHSKYIEYEMNHNTNTEDVFSVNQNKNSNGKLYLFYQLQFN
jgi:hypothetical protein